MAGAARPLEPLPEEAPLEPEVGGVVEPAPGELPLPAELPPMVVEGELTEDDDGEVDGDGDGAGAAPLETAVEVE